MKFNSLEELAESLWPDMQAWPLTPFGTIVLLVLMTGIAIGVYEWLECLALRGLL